MSATVSRMPAARGLPGRHGDGLARVDDFHAAYDAVGGAHRDRADLIATDVLLDFGHELARVHFDRDGVVELRQLLRLELDVEYRTDDLNHLPNAVLVLFCHSS